MELAAGSVCAAVFTRNAFCAAPVLVAREHLESTPPEYLLVNTGNANAGTGAAGVRDARQCCSDLAELAGCSTSAVVPFSTGVIGESLPVDRIRSGSACSTGEPCGGRLARSGQRHSDYRYQAQGRMQAN